MNDHSPFRTASPAKAGGIPWRGIGIAAAALAGAAVLNNAAGRHAEAKFPPQGRFIRVGGVRLHYRDVPARAAVAAGPPVIILHGNGSLADDFMVSGVVEMLGADRRVILFDRPGYGFSERPGDRAWTAEAQAAVMSRAAQILGIGPAVIVGHSWGVLTALAWGLARPADAAALVLISGYFYRSLRLDAMSLAVAEVPVIGRAFTDGWAPLQARVVGPAGLKMLFAPQDVTPGFRRNMPLGLLLRPGQIAASAEDGVQMPANAARLAAHYSELAMPITVIWGDGDKLVRQSKQSQRFVDAVPQALAMPMAGHGHMLHHNLPGSVARAIAMAA